MRGQELVNTVINQLGGNRFIAMTGAKNFVFSEDDQKVRMTIGSNPSKANRLEIRLTPMDTYDMRLFRFVPGKLKVDHKKGTAIFTDDKLTEIKTFHDVYCDQLQELFTDVTKMYTHL